MAIFNCYVSSPEGSHLSTATHIATAPPGGADGRRIDLQWPAEDSEAALEVGRQITYAVGHGFRLAALFGSFW